MAGAKTEKSRECLRRVCSASQCAASQVGLFQQGCEFIPGVKNKQYNFTIFLFDSFVVLWN